MKYFILILFVFCNCLHAQQASNYGAKNNDIRANFSIKTLEAYEENSFSKVSDFYQLLEIYSDKNSSEALKKQVEENINSLVRNDVLISDFFTSDKIIMGELLKKIQSKGLKFEVKNIRKQAASDNYWIASYTLDISGNREVVQKNISQKIYLYPEEKSFGDKKKEVWSLFLGEIE